MVTLTRAELEKYPGATDTERELAHRRERQPAPAPLRPKRLGGPSVPGAPPLPRQLDLRPFPGRDREERIACYLVAHLPRAASWSPETLRELAAKLANSSDLLE